jgi:5-methylcytosine-specific restriction endonuclease McrA
MEEYKTCTKCGQTKPRTNEFFYKNSRSPDGLRPDCADCGRQRSANYARQNVQASRNRANNWRLNNPERKKEANALWYEANKERIRSEWKELYAKNPEPYKVSSRVRRAREKLVPYERYTVDQVIAKWGELCHLCGLPIDLTAPRQTKIPGWENGLHLDHVIPISHGGPDTIENVKPSHGKCNLTKNGQSRKKPKPV